jgi:flagellar biosynthesis anti-sigma factor FlgM
MLTKTDFTQRGVAAADRSTPNAGRSLVTDIDGKKPAPKQAAPLHLSALATYSKTLSDTAPIDASRVAAIKLEMARGTYVTDPEHIAEKMMQFDLGWSEGQGADATGKREKS